MQELVRLGENQSQMTVPIRLKESFVKPSFNQKKGKENFCLAKILSIIQGGKSMIQGKVVKIGEEAITDEAMLILFDKTATESLARYSIIQEVTGNPVFDLKVHDRVAFDTQEYEITYVGSIANHNLMDISHVTLVFDDAPTVDPIANGIYLKPKKLPVITNETVITYG